MAESARAIAERRPPVVGLNCNMMPRRNVIKMAAFCKSRGITVVLGGPDPANYLDEYLAHGADLIVDTAGSLGQSIAAVRIGGTIAFIGLLSGMTTEVDLVALMGKSARIQAIDGGSRAMFESMDRPIQ
jgi:NADPH:quinone reductase-like Zn-dependent oxidoreductase